MSIVRSAGGRAGFWSHSFLTSQRESAQEGRPEGQARADRTRLGDEPAVSARFRSRKVAANWGLK